MAKSNVLEMQKSNSANVTVTKNTRRDLTGDTDACSNCAIMKNADSAKMAA